MELEFSNMRDITTGILDKTPRFSFTVNKSVNVDIALCVPDEGFIAGAIYASNMDKLTEDQMLTFKALGVSNPNEHVHRYDIPPYLQERFYNHLVRIGAPLN